MQLNQICLVIAVTNQTCFSNA